MLRPAAMPGLHVQLFRRLQAMDRKKRRWCWRGVGRMEIMIIHGLFMIDIPIIYTYKIPMYIYNHVYNPIYIYMYIDIYTYNIDEQYYPIP